MVSEGFKTSVWTLSLKVRPQADSGRVVWNSDYANQEFFYCRPLRLPETRW